ncbi:MAG: sigma-70 family RNA polymerase sigma factor [Acidobacteriia bacterium]|nr:sigma-70 family RNA polymerase sigma factor [Terriglobia bacterium]
MERALSSGAVAVAEGMDDFEALVEHYRPRVFRFILASLRNRETAENLTQDCFVRAYRARDRFRGGASVSTWLMQIAANLVRDHESSGRLKFWRRMLASSTDASEVEDWIPDRRMSPEALASAKEQIEAIWKAASKLTERQRTVFLLRFVEEMELLEIAQATGLSEGTVKSHLFRALAAVRKELR